MNTKIKVYDNLEDLSTEDLQLYKLALKNSDHAYAPYSKFKVCAIAEMDNGTIYYACNHENASYPVGICAEQSLVSYVNAHRNGNIIKSIGVIGVHETIENNTPITPCGSCRQVIAEMEEIQQTPIRILLFSVKGSTWIFDSIKEILPFHFSKDRLLG